MIKWLDGLKKKHKSWSDTGITTSTPLTNKITTNNN